jgi:hypothetical protein
MPGSMRQGLAMFMGSVLDLKRHPAHLNSENLAALIHLGSTGAKIENL